MITDATPFHIDFKAVDFKAVDSAAVDSAAVDDHSSAYLRQSGFESGATHFVVVYDLDNAVGGALINLTPTIAMVTRWCAAYEEHTLAIVKYLRDRFDEVEIHINVDRCVVQLYLNLDFVEKQQCCTCAVNRNQSHLCWVPPALETTRALDEIIVSKVSIIF